MVRRRKRIFRRTPRYFRKSYRKKMTIPIAPVMGLVGTVMGNGALYNEIISGNMDGAYKWLRFNLTGIDGNGKFNVMSLVQNWSPTIAGVGVHIAANKLGLNRMLANAKVPYVRV